MSSTLICARLLFMRLPRNITTQQTLRSFSRSCALSDAGDRNRGSWFKSTKQESFSKQRRPENSAADESEFESRDSRSFSVNKPRITRSTVPIRDERMAEKPRFRKSFESSQESFDEEEEPGFWPTQEREDQRNSGRERFSADAGDRNRGSWYKSTQQESFSKQRRPENSAADESEFESRDSRSFSVNRPRITRSTVPMRDERMAEKPRFRKNFESSRESFDEEEEQGFWPTQSREKQTDKGREGYFAGQKSFRISDRGSASENSVRSGKWMTEKPGKNYNYGLTGIGKELPQKVKAAPAVKGEILYGIHSALLALLAGRRDFHKFYIRDNLVESEKPAVQQLMALVREKKIEFEACDKSLLTSLSQARPHQGVCLDAGQLDYEILGSDESVYEDSSSEASDPRLFVVLDSVQDPMNLGAVIRSSYFLGVDQLFVVKDNSCSLTPVVSKASAGAMEISKIFAIPDLVEFLEDFKERGWDLVGTTSSANPSNPDRVVSLNDTSLKRNTILILGNEGSGLAANVESRCHRLVRIPPSGKRDQHPLIDCLNVSVATGIILHHLCQLKTPPRSMA